MLLKVPKKTEKTHICLFFFSFLWEEGVRIPIFDTYPHYSGGGGGGVMTSPIEPTRKVMALKGPWPLT